LFVRHEQHTEKKSEQYGFELFQVYLQLHQQQAISKIKKKGKG
jgi:hypothetical protein